jgi:hypothetical protein
MHSCLTVLCARHLPPEVRNSCPMSDMRDTTNAFSSGLSVLLLGMSHKLCLLLSPTTASFPTDSLPNGHLLRWKITSREFPRMTRTLLPMPVLSRTTTNAHFFIQILLHLLFAFLLDVCAPFAPVFIPFSINKFQTNCPAVVRVNDGNAAHTVTCLKRESTSAMR